MVGCTQDIFSQRRTTSFLREFELWLRKKSTKAMAAAEIDAAKGAIATAGESRKAIQSSGLHSKVQVMMEME
ncbi:hypothetical protein NC653_006700 [Populus alba x Populus x berolinensis]|uniref:Uncharacterized protein n=1 Tax=Populus alba x Populus x berolinensis TaxID=444605 RepID=A0AAD6RGG1_9ROSI|nr:hypothetical protein NC653_006700 [Populus alba x Populus x berolinensis]